MDSMQSHLTWHYRINRVLKIFYVISYLWFYIYSYFWEYFWDYFTSGNISGIIFILCRIEK
jgi:hypothetical protein